MIGGSACPPAMLDTLIEDEYGVEVIHAWGMTEMSPLGTLARLSWEAVAAAARRAARSLRKSRAA